MNSFLFLSSTECSSKKLQLKLLYHPLKLIPKNDPSLSPKFEAKRKQPVQLFEKKNTSSAKTNANYVLVASLTCSLGAIIGGPDITRY